MKNSPWSAQAYVDIGTGQGQERGIGTQRVIRGENAKEEV